MTDELFADDHNLDSLQRIRPLGQDFEMWVTPRFVDPYQIGGYECFTANLVRSISKRHEVFVDVGAHYGFFSLLAHRGHPGIEILAIEPAPTNHEILRRNLELNDIGSAHRIEAAIASAEGEAEYLISAASDNCGFHAHPNAPTQKAIQVETHALTQLLDPYEGRSVLIKVDTDGHELEVLKDLERVRPRLRDLSLIIELNPKMQRRAGHHEDDLLQRLEDLGLAIFLLDDDRHRSYRIRSDSNWQSLFDQSRYTNLYCRPSEDALSCFFFSHTALLEGAERSLLELASQLVEDHGAACTVAVPGDGPLVARLQAAGCGVVKASYGWWCETRPVDDAQAKAGLKRCLRELEPELVHEVERMAPDVIVTQSSVILAGSVIAAFTRTPHIWHLCEYGPLDPDYSFYLPAEEILTWIRDSSNLLFGATRRLCSRLFPDLDEERCIPLYRALVLATDDLAPAREEHGATTDAQIPSLAELATVCRPKNQSLCIRALSELVGRGHDIRLSLYGRQDPDYMEELEALIAELDLGERIHFFGFVEDVNPVLRETGILVVSWAGHAFGRIAAEGARLARPVVYPDTSDISEYLDHRKTGMAYTAGDPVSMADQIETLILEPGLRKRIAIAAAEHTRQLFTRSVFSGRFFHEALALKGSPPATGFALGLPFLEALSESLEEQSSASAYAEDLRAQLRMQVEAREGLEQELEASAARDHDAKIYVADLEKQLTEHVEQQEQVRAYVEKLERLLASRES